MCGTECQCKHVGLDHPNPRLFVDGQAGSVSIVYVIYRVVVAVFFGFILAYSASGSDHDYGAQWLIYLSHWSLTVLTFNVLAQAIVVLARYHKRVKQGVDSPTKMTLILKIVWVLQNVTLTSAFIITIVYWLAVYDGWDLTLVIVATHAVNSVYVICDVCVTGIPVRMLHFYQPLLYGIAYSVFSVIYWKAGGTNWDGENYIYSVLDYSEKPSTAATWLAILLAGTVICHTIMYGVFRLRVYLYSRCARARVEPHDVEAPTEPMSIHISTIESDGKVIE